MSDIESNQPNKPSLGRRKFLTKTAAAAVVGAIPAKSVWANGITNSIMASGHGSDFANGRPLVLLGPCEILSTFSDNPNLQFTFFETFGEGSNQTLFNILEYYCFCPSTNNLPNGISNVVFYLRNGIRVKIEDYLPDETKISNHPTRYFKALYDQYESPVVDYVIKAGTVYYDSRGTQDIPSWYNGHSGMPEIKASTLLVSGTGICDKHTVLMVTVYLNAILDLETNSERIYYPILNSSENVSQLVTSILRSTEQELEEVLGASIAECCPLD